MKAIATALVLALVMGIACVSFDLDSRRFQCDGATNTCDVGFACSADGYCTVIIATDAAVGDVPVNDGATGEICNNGVDDDNDGYTDCADSECPGTNTCGIGCTCVSGAPTEVACGDGIDNDRDGLADCRDPDCGTCQGTLMCCPDGACRPGC